MLCRLFTQAVGSNLWKDPFDVREDDLDESRADEFLDPAADDLREPETDEFLD
jgi:hypothetical protein